MIAYLRGRLIEKQPTRIIVDVAGVGYDVAVPLSTYYTAGDPGAEVTLRMHTHVREDQLALYGFATPDVQAGWLPLLSATVDLERIERFLAKADNVDRGLARYARSAATGCLQ